MPHFSFFELFLVLVPIGVFATVIAVVIGKPLVNAYARKIERSQMPGAVASTEVVARLERIEQSLEAMSMEIERISEGQRFTTKLLSERRTLAIPPASSEGVHTEYTHDRAREGARPADGTVLVESARKQ